MLGMMNCPTETVDFYAAAPSHSADFATDAALVKAFSRPKERPQVTYSNDGRKFINGKLVSSDSDSEPESPQLSWNRLIFRNFAAGQLRNDLRRKPVAGHQSPKVVVKAA
ncbi:Protein F26G1.2 b [Aphelenchoides avenae]|nr:Protein F26G1.2 b [Aphelenchus avenae]